MHAIWNEMGMSNITEQSLVDQKNNTGFRTGRNTKKHRGYLTW